MKCTLKTLQYVKPVKLEISAHVWVIKILKYFVEFTPFFVFISDLQCGGKYRFSIIWTAFYVKKNMYQRVK